MKNAWILHAILLLPCIAMACAPSKPNFGKVIDPNDPEAARPRVDTDDRQSMGLSPHDWEGVVHPDVDPTLDKLEATFREMTERLAKGRDVEAFDTLMHMQFPGKVYVQVHLVPRYRDDADRDDARAIDTIEHEVLASLSAKDFFTRLVFKDEAGFIGFANRAALDQLREHPYVSGICLDDKPFPLPYGTVYSQYLPPARPGDVPADAPGLKEKIVAPDVYRAFAMTDRVDVMIAPDRRKLPKLTSDPALARQRFDAYEAAEAAQAERILQTLTADDFWPVTTPFPFSGCVTKEGLRKLSEHPEVLKVGLPGFATTQGEVGAS